MIGGMLSSTVLTLIVIPAIYAIVNLRIIASAQMAAMSGLKRAAE
jgi:Cu/Ag efflux pump CusA